MPWKSDERPDTRTHRPTQVATLRAVNARGSFIVLEGLDGAGTTTQALRLAELLERAGLTVLRTQQPSRRAIGAAIREQLRALEHPPDPRVLALLFAADRIDHVTAEIEPALARGEVVVCDRYVLSSWAYQGLDCDPAWVRSINAHAPWPDLTAVLRLSPERAAERVAARAHDRELFDALATQRRVAAAYDEALAAKLPGVVSIDAEASIEAVGAALVQACVAALPQLQACVENWPPRPVGA
ncbi:MAG: dTMP kinase [Deltaproteobacteria bacterium]|nr:dTMP kinase [Nannocystaceae bacterium]